MDTAQLLAAADEEDVSPRTALFLAMKAKVKGERRGRKKGKVGGGEGEEGVGRGGGRGGGEGGAVKELSRSLELDHQSMSSSTSRSRGDGEGGEGVEGERRLKAKREKKLGYKLCKVSGCLEVRAKEGHRKYCREHQGIHVQGNPNERRGQQRGHHSARG